MKFTVKRAVLSNALDKVAECLPKVSLSFYNNVFVEAKNGEVKLGATNTKMVIWSTINLVDVEEEGSEMISSEELLKISKINAVGDVTIETKESSYVITTENSEWSFPSVEKSSEGLLKPIVLDTSMAESVNKDVFISGLQKVSYAICTDESRINLNVVSINGEQMVATDGFRLHKMNMGVKLPTVLLPGYSIKPLIKILKLTNSNDMYINVDKSFVTFKVLDDIISVRLMNCEFPDINPVIDGSLENKCVLKTKTSNLLSVFKSAKVNMSLDSAIRFKFSSSKGEVFASNYKGKAFKAVIKPYSWTGEDLEILLNCDYAVDALNGLKEDDVEVKFSIDSIKPPMRNL
jgi:DNA polymerase III sliding clamp (beta) subunit (PCNA family)